MNKKNNTPKTKKKPLRRCTGCGESFLKKELIRVVRSPEGTVSLDFTGKAGGRGAYVCKRAECFRRARKQKRFQSALECEIPDALMDALENEIKRCEADALEQEAQ